MTDLLTLMIRNAFVKSQRKKMTESEAMKVWDGWLKAHKFQPLDEDPMPAPAGFAYVPGGKSGK